MERKEKKGWPLFRLIIPRFPEINIFTNHAERTTALGPVMVATAANKLWDWNVEVIDENNYKGPRDNRGLPDHEFIQKERPADVVGFYCGLTSTMERAWELSVLYQSKGVFTIAGGWHAHYCPEETMRHNIDVVVHGDGEIAIRQILTAIKEKKSFKEIAGISFWDNNGQIKTNSTNTVSGMLEADLDDLPFPDFGLLKYSKGIKIYPLGRIRGCRMNCEFCSVKGKPRWASSQHFFDTINLLVETRKAKSFFIVDDRSEEDREGTVEFFRMISGKYGRKLSFTVQARLEASKDDELLDAMKAAGVGTVCIGYESPDKLDLKAMRKGYHQFSDIVGWTEKWHKKDFRVHQMLIFGYPPKEKGEPVSVKEMTKSFKALIRATHPESLQVLHPVPLVGTELRQRLEKEGRIFPLDVVPWSRYDGSYICFSPDNMTLRELQEIPMVLMKRFYDPMGFLRIILRTVAFPADYVLRGWERWYRGWYGDIVRYGGHLLIIKWRKRQRIPDFLKKLEQHEAR